MTPRGFTLLEVLLAAMITAVIGVAVAQLVFVSLQADERISGRGALRAQVRALSTHLRADFSALVPPGATYASGLVGEEAQAGSELMSARDLGDVDPASVDLGSRARLTLAVKEAARSFGLETPLGEGALLQVIYYIDDDPATVEEGLVREALRVRDPAPLSDPEPLEVLAPDAVAFEATYFDGQDWAETYDSSTTTTLPAAVRLTVWVRTDAGVREQTLTLSPPCSRGSTDLREATQ